MAEGAAGTAPIETRADLGDKPDGVVSFWLMQLRLVERQEQRWVYRGRSIIRRYRDERLETPYRQASRYNILWANVETLKPWLYSQLPKPVAERRYKDPDPVGRLAAQVLERALSYEDDADEFDDTMKAVVQDRLLPGRGVARVRYETVEGDVLPGQEAQAEGKPKAAPLRRVDWERCCSDYVFWEDFRCSPARRWKEVTWVAFRTYLTRDKLVGRFGADIGKKVTLDYTPAGMERTDDKVPPDGYKKATVWEIWDKTKREVIWVAPSYSTAPLDKKPDPWKLRGFFPCPCPVFSTTTNDSMIPVPDYAEYQDQALELDAITGRLTKLIQACKVVGIYAGSEKATISQIFATSRENQLVPHEDWIGLVQKGGLSALIEWVPVQQIAGVVIQLYQAREQIKNIIYEVTGLADIVRASTSPNETAAAQELKSNYATMRLTAPQKDVARFARDMIRLKAEIMSKHFAPETLALMSNTPEPVPQPEPPEPLGANAMNDPAQMQEFLQAQQAYQAAMAEWTKGQEKANAQFLAACKLLKEDAGHGFRIDIETDSTIAADDQVQKQQAIEFLTDITMFMEKIIPGVAATPSLAPLAGEMIMFAVRHFKAGRTLEGKFQEAVDNMLKQVGQQPAAPQGQQGDPGAAEAAGTAAAAHASAQGEVASAQIDAASKTEATQAKVAVDMADIQSRERIAIAKLQAEREKNEADITMAGAREIGAQAQAVEALRQVDTIQ